MTTPRPDRIGLVVIIVAFVALAQLLFFTYQQRQDTQCQAQVNSTFLSVVKQRANINAASDESFETLVTDISKAKTQEQVTKAFTEFNKRKDAIAELRNSFKYPDIEGACQ